MSLAYDERDLLVEGYTSTWRRKMKEEGDLFKDFLFLYFSGQEASCELKLVAKFH
jgi:hypothetical protein